MKIRLILILLIAPMLFAGCSTTNWHRTEREKTELSVTRDSSGNIVGVRERERSYTPRGDEIGVMLNREAEAKENKAILKKYGPR